MLTIIFVCVLAALLAIGFVFALMAKDNQRRGQSGSPNTQTDGAKQGRAGGLD
jgi:hypothetical protein